MTEEEREAVKRLRTGDIWWGDPGFVDNSAYRGAKVRRDINIALSIIDRLTAPASASSREALIGDEELEAIEAALSKGEGDTVGLSAGIEIIKRLRLAESALNRLAAEKDALFETADKVSRARIADWRRNYEEQRQRAEAAEAQRDKAVEALERLGSSETMTFPFAIDDSPTGKELKARIDYARAALAEIDHDL